MVDSHKMGVNTLNMQYNTFASPDVLLVDTCVNWHTSQLKYIVLK